MQDHFQKCFYPHVNTESRTKGFVFYSPIPVSGTNHGVWDMHIKPPDKISGKQDKKTRTATYKP